ncbi:MAG: sensor histidine kinase [Acetobacter aceti]
MRRRDPQHGWRSCRFVVSFLIEIRSLFDSVRSRMAIVIIGSVLPVAALGALLIWQDYVRLNETGTQRGEFALSELGKYLESEAFRTESMLGQIDQTADNASLRRFLLLAQAASKGRYCLLAVVDEAGNLLDALTGADAADTNCFVAARDIKPATVPAHLWMYQDRPYLRIVQEFPAADEGNGKRFIVAVQSVAWDPSAFDSASSFHEGAEKVSSKSLSAWFVMEDGSLVSVCPRCVWASPAAEMVAKARKAARNHYDRMRIEERIGSRSYVYGSLGYGDSALIEVRQLPEERRALFLLIGWIMMVGILLAAGLSGVMVAGRRLVIEPLNQLTHDVETWMRKGKYENIADSRMPQEFRKLSGAFGTATWRLAHREAELEAALMHQKRLVAEIHHRVKNNLQIVGSLLSLQANRASGSDARMALLAARNRVRILSMLQRLLYVGDELADLSMTEFLPALTQQIQRSAPEDVRRRVTIEEDAGGVMLSPDIATPVVLIIAEVLLNALNHGFSEERSGTVRVSLSQANDVMTLTIEGDDDSTTALQGGGDEGEFGLQLVRGFVRQIGGKLRIEEGAGLRVVVTCPVKGSRRDEGGELLPIREMRS